MLSIAGVGLMASSAKWLAPTIFCLRFGNQQLAIGIHLLPNITSKLLSKLIDLNMLPLPNYVICNLADPSFGKPASIDTFLSAEIFFGLFTGEQRSIAEQCI